MARKILKAVLMISICLLMLIQVLGCQKTEEATTVLSAGKYQENTLPEDGIIPQKTFDELMGTVNTELFTGSDGNHHYQWTFNGQDITKPMDFIAKIGFNNDDMALVQQSTESAKVMGFNFGDNAEVPGKYNLKISLSEKWECESIELYVFDKAANSLGRVGQVKMDNSGEKTAINFGVSVAKGQFYLVSSTKIENPEELLGEETILTDEQKEQKAEDQKDFKDQVIENDKNYSGSMDGYSTQLDKIPDGQPGPSEPQGSMIDDSVTKYCTLSVRCDTIWWPEYYQYLNVEKEPLQPKDGTIFEKQTVAYHPGEMVFDVLYREMRNAGIHMEFVMTPGFNSNYIQGINNLYEHDCGEMSGWMYNVNGWYPNYGCSRYLIKEGDDINWNYTCDLGRDLETTF
jgi:hypothetical protein